MAQRVNQRYNRKKPDAINQGILSLNAVKLELLRLEKEIAIL